MPLVSRDRILILPADLLFPAPVDIPVGAAVSAHPVGLRLYEERPVLLKDIAATCQDGLMNSQHIIAIDVFCAYGIALCPAVYLG